MKPEITSELPRRQASVFGPILCFGFGTAVGMWMLGFVTHHPAFHVPSMASGILLLFALLAGCIFAGGAVEKKRSWVVGLGTGLVATALTLFIIASYIAEEKGKALDVAVLAKEFAGFLAVGGAAGLVGGGLGAVLETIFSSKRRELIVPGIAPDWLSRFGIVAAVSVAPLLLLGGWTTSDSAALSVPDWPTTYGANMFLYPISEMSRPRVYLEHSHRLFGTLVGMTTIALVLYTFLGGERRRWMKIMVVTLLVLVIAQGVLGGIRVNFKSTGLALAHGILAQIFFALMVAYAAFLSPTFKNKELRGGVLASRRPKSMATAFLHTTIVQLIFGALYRHLGTPHAMYTHMAFSLAVVVFAVFASFEVRGMLAAQTEPQWARPRRAMSALGTAIMACVSLQFMLGWAALLVVGIKKGKPELPFAQDAVEAAQKSLLEQLTPTAHQANGALLLALATLAYVWVWRFWKRWGAQTT
jgi:cytochrome c oxidase assembly protein subunit 15